MDARTTVVFADLTGSTGMYETLGNAKATATITRLTQWIGQVCVSHGGRVVKTLGDGVLAVFPEGTDAAAAVVELQRNHQKRIAGWPNPLRMRLKIGLACGEIVEVDGDCYGDAVNIASRLADLSGADQIWATDTVIHQIHPSTGIRSRNLGPINIRGKSESRIIYMIEWKDEVASDMFTVAGGLALVGALPGAASAQGKIELSWLDVNASFDAEDLPVHLGRDDEAQFVVNDQRVSRLHAKLDWRNGTFVLCDVSSYGTWLRFKGSDTELPLRRGETTAAALVASVRRAVPASANRLQRRSSPQQTWRCCAWASEAAAVTAPPCRLLRAAEKSRSPYYELFTA